MKTTMKRGFTVLAACVLVAGCEKEESEAARVLRESEQFRAKLAAEPVAKESEPDRRQAFFVATVSYHSADLAWQVAKKRAEFDRDRPQAEWVMALEAAEAAEDKVKKARERMLQAERELREVDHEGWVALKNWQGEWGDRKSDWESLNYRIDHQRRDEIERKWMEIQLMDLEDAVALGSSMTTAAGR